jgi:hypothetical protein
MAVSLDLADAVLTVVTALNDNFSTVPVEVAPGYTRGGYSSTLFGIKPRIEPVEGVAGKLRKGIVNLDTEQAKAIIYVYEPADTEDETDVQEEYADVRVNVSIDIRARRNKAQLVALYNEIRRILMKVKKTIGGNYTYIKRTGKADLTNRSIGIYRYVVETQLTKVSDYIGHA